MAGLEGLRILDISTGIAGPFCARLLADGGAHTIKIEDPAQGDPTRREGGVSGQGEARQTSPLYVFLNQNKQGLSLDIGCSSGQEIFKKLVAKSDVVIESFEPGTMEQLGLGYSELAAVNPGIILASITQYGQTGPYRQYKGDHLAISALGGWSFSFGEQDREPLQPGFPIMYYMAGTYGAIGILAAVRGRREDGRGQHVDVSAQEACLNILAYPQVLAQYNCPVPVRSFSASMQSFYVMAKDGWVALNHLSALEWENLCALIGAFHLAEDPTLLYDIERKRAILPELLGIAAKWAKDKTSNEIFHAAQELRVPAGIPYTPKEMLCSDQFIARDFFFKTIQPGMGEFSQPRNPFKSISWRTDWQAAPDVGQDNVDVLGNIGLQQEDLRELRNAGVI